VKSGEALGGVELRRAFPSFTDFQELCFFGFATWKWLILFGLSGASLFHSPKTSISLEGVPVHGPAGNLTGISCGLLEGIAVMI
jgi:hypothetical protein